jgi:glycosyltransferase involved in cell wall biosynthesis
VDVHIIQHGLLDFHSHYFNETLAWREAVLETGQKWNCYSHTSLSPDHCRLTGAIPAFQSQPDVGKERDPGLAPLSDFIDFAEMFAADCRRVLGTTVKGGDVVVVPYATERDIFGAALWLRDLAPGRRPHLAFKVHRPDWSWSISKDRRVVTGDTNYWRYAGKRLHSVTKDMAPFIAVTDRRLQQVLQMLFPMKVSQVPMATFMRKLPDGAFGAAKAFDLGMIGQFRPERGSAAIPATLAELAGRYRDLRFLLQVENAGERNSILQRFADAGSPDAIEVVVGSQTIDQFYRNAARCRLLLMPYAPDRYRMRASGVLSTAVGLGIPVIVPDNTWLSDRIREGSASGFVGGDLGAAFLEGILRRPKDEWDLMEIKAAGLAESWRRENSAHTVLAQILAFCGDNKP